MELERWTEIRVIRCPKIASRVATGLVMTGLRNANPGPEFTDVCATLAHCVGATECGLTLPATAADMVHAHCPIAALLREQLNIHPSPALAAAEEPCTFALPTDGESRHGQAAMAAEFEERNRAISHAPPHTTEGVPSWKRALASSASR